MGAPPAEKRALIVLAQGSLGETASELQIRTFQRNNQIFSFSKRKFIFIITFTLHKQVLKCPSLRSFARPLLFFAEGSFKWKNNRQSGQITRLFARNCQRKLLDLVTWYVLTLLKCPTTMHQKPPSLRSRLTLTYLYIYIERFLVIDCCNICSPA